MDQGPRARPATRGPCRWTDRAATRAARRCACNQTAATAASFLSRSPGEIPAAGPVQQNRIPSRPNSRRRGGAKAFVGMLSIVRQQSPATWSCCRVPGGEWVRQSRRPTQISADPSTRLFPLSGWTEVGLRLVRRRLRDRRSPDSHTKLRRPKALTASIEVDAAAPGAGFRARSSERTYGVALERHLHVERRRWETDAEGTPIDPRPGVTLIRYPGGIYSDFYHWRDGIGPFRQASWSS